MGVNNQSKRKKRRRESPPLGPSPGAGAEAFRRAKHWATYSSIGLLVGILLTATRGAILGSLHDLALAVAPWLSVASMAGAIAAAHNLGRCGPDPGE